MGSVSLVSPPDHDALISLKAFKLEFAPECGDDLLRAFIAEASSRIETLLGRPLVRAQYAETLRVSGRTRIHLTVRPVAAIQAITYQGGTQDPTGFEIDSRNAGFLFHNAGSFDSEWGASAFSDDRDPNAWSVTTTAGWFVPDDDFLGSVSVSSVDNSYNSASGGFPTHLVAGDWIRPESHTNAANNRKQRVVSATATKIIVAGTLVTETAAFRKIGVSDLPAAITRAAMMLAKDTYARRTQSTTGDLIGETIVGLSSLSWSSGSSSSSTGSSVEESASDLLFPFMDF